MVRRGEGGQVKMRLRVAMIGLVETGTCAFDTAEHTPTEGSMRLISGVGKVPCSNISAITGTITAISRRGEIAHGLVDGLGDRSEHTRS